MIPKIQTLAASSVNLLLTASEVSDAMAGRESRLDLDLIHCVRADLLGHLVLRSNHFLRNAMNDVSDRSMSLTPHISWESNHLELLARLQVATMNLDLIDSGKYIVYFILDL